MKKLLLFLFIAATTMLAKAQDPEYDTIPPYQKDSLHLPKFTVLKTDSSYTNDMAIPKGKPVVIVYFSPTCGHCQIAADEFSKKMKEMRDINFVWVSYNHPLSEIDEFANNFNLRQFNNIVVGRLTDYSLPSYYRIKYTPYMAVYNKEHHLLQTWEQGTEADTIIALLKK